jgi:hypothetical protein
MHLRSLLNTSVKRFARRFHLWPRGHSVQEESANKKRRQRLCLTTARALERRDAWKRKAQWAGKFGLQRLRRLDRAENVQLAPRSLRIYNSFKYIQFTHSFRIISEYWRDEMRHPMPVGANTQTVPLNMLYVQVFSLSGERLLNPNKQVQRQTHKFCVVVENSPARNSEKCERQSLGRSIQIETIMG